MAEARVVDTDVFSFLFKEDDRAELYAPELEGRHLILSFQTVAELWHWAEGKAWGERRRQRLEQFLEHFSIISSDALLCRRWGLVMAEGYRKGRPLLGGDAWIAAIALELQLPLVTHNKADFSCLDGLQVITR